MNIRFMIRVGVFGLGIGMAIAATGIATGMFPIIVAGTIVLAITFVSMQAGWFLSPRQ